MSAPAVDTRTLPAGREMDALVAVRVMGLNVRPITVIGSTTRSDVGTVSAPYRMVNGAMGVQATRLPDYSTEIAAAWLVVVVMRERWRAGGYGDDAPKRMSPYWTLVDCGEEGWRADITIASDDGDMESLFEVAPTLPLAICRAALAFIEAHNP